MLMKIYTLFAEKQIKDCYYKKIRNQEAKYSEAKVRNVKQQNNKACSSLKKIDWIVIILKKGLVYVNYEEELFLFNKTRQFYKNFTKRKEFSSLFAF